MVYRPRLERLFLPWYRREGLAAVEQINQRALDRFGAGLLEQGGERKATLSPHTVSSYLRTVNGLLSWARSEGEKVSATARWPKTPQRIVETLTRDEIATVEKVGNERDAGRLAAAGRSQPVNASPLCLTLPGTVMTGLWPRVVAAPGRRWCGRR